MSEEHTKGNFNYFGLTKLAVDNSTTVILLTIMIVIFGVMGYSSMPKESFPEVKFPQVFVNTIYFGNSAEDIENLISRPLEQEINQVDGIKNITSTSQQDYSIIIAEFQSDVDIANAVRLVKDAVDKAKPELPTDLNQEPTVEDINLSEMPIMAVNISGNVPLPELKEYAEYLQDIIEDLKEISSVELKGDLEREVKIDVNLPAMETRQVSFQDIENAVKRENVTMSAGEIINGDLRRAVRIVGEYKDVKKLENIIVKSENQNPIYLRDIADVSFGFKSRTSIARSNGKPVISLDVVKKSGENLIEAADKIQAIVDDAVEHVLPKEIEVQIFNDQSVQTRDQVSNLENSIIFGVILVVFVLLFFLGLRNSLFVGIAIPLSMLMGITILNTMGTTMNMVVLFSLILALGMLVDNAIVVVENVYRFRQEGFGNMEAAKRGTSEVAVPIIASTATTLAAFLPLAFWPGIMGSFMKFLPMTLIVVLLSSLFVALVINPVLTANYMVLNDDSDVVKNKRRKRRALIQGVVFIALGVLCIFFNLDMLRNLLILVGVLILLNTFVLAPLSNLFQSNFLPWLEKVYQRFITFALQYSVAVFAFTFVLLIAAFGLIASRSPKVIFFPQGDPTYVNVFIELPMGTDIEATNKIAKEIATKIEDKVAKYGEVIEAVLTQIGENTSDPSEPMQGGASPNKARITTSFVQYNKRGGLDTKDVMKEIRELIKGYPGVQLIVDKNSDGPPTGKPINLELRGKNIVELLKLAERLKTYINQEGIPGIEELLTDVKLGKPELILNVNREAAQRFGLSTYQIADAVRTSIYGKEISKYKVGEDDYDIFVRLNDAYRYNVANLLNQSITFRAPNGQISQVPISTVTDVKYSSTYSAIKRKNLERSVTIFSNVLEGYNANEINEQLRLMLEDFDMPKGYKYEFTGEQQQQAEDTGFLVTAFMVAIFMVFLIIVAQFNSVVTPIIIILSVLFSLIGVLMGYVIFDEDIVVIMTGIGIISLAGIVVNNAIVLIDYTNILMKEQRLAINSDTIYNMTNTQVKDVIIKAGTTRLRPVLLTAITTVLGLIPLALGLNINFSTLLTDLDPQFFIGGDNVAMWGPMAWTVIYGLVFATFLTLIVVPSMYLLAYQLMKFTRSTQ